MYELISRLWLTWLATTCADSRVFNNDALMLLQNSFAYIGNILELYFKNRFSLSQNDSLTWEKLRILFSLDMSFQL